MSYGIPTNASDQLHKKSETDDSLLEFEHAIWNSSDAVEKLQSRAVLPALSESVSQPASGAHAIRHWRHVVCICGNELVHSSREPGLTWDSQLSGEKLR